MRLLVLQCRLLMFLVAGVWVVHKHPSRVGMQFVRKHPSHLGMQSKRPVYTSCVHLHKFIAPSAVVALAVSIVSY